MIVGLDLGSRAIKLAVMEGGELVDSRVQESGFDPHGQARELLAPYRGASVVATGYGRHLAGNDLADAVITEIRAHARGARHLFPGCSTLLDVGGQDSKVISLDTAGRVAGFQMNDKCAAGTGRFLEIMAATLGYRLDEFGPVSLTATKEVPLNSMCAVFAESEVISLKNRGFSRGDIARSVHLAVAERLSAMLERSRPEGPLAFSGGVARNRCLVQMLERRIGRDLMVPEAPELLGAIGAALHGADRSPFSSKENE